MILQLTSLRLSVPKNEQAKNCEIPQSNRGTIQRFPTDSLNRDLFGGPITELLVGRSELI